MIEKNKKLYSDISREKIEFSQTEEFQESYDTFKTFQSFMTEKDGVLK